jgi:predicted GNAT superfamily acetyltransferase
MRHVGMNYKYVLSHGKIFLYSHFPQCSSEVEAHYHKEQIEHKLNSQVVNVLTLRRYWTFIPQIFNLRVSGSGKAEHFCRMKK